MDLNIDQPIAALASPPGGAARGIVRISGDHIRDILTGWFKPDDVEEWKLAKTASLHMGILQFDESGQPIFVPVQLMIWPNHRSYTGQQLIELHLPGSPCLLEAVLGEAYRRGARPARPGEFTMRAFLAGKLDLLQAEAVLGVIDASNHVELQVALAQLAGGVSQHLLGLRGGLIELLADIEAGLDFVDEDIEFVSRNEVISRLTTAQQFVSSLSRQTQDRMQARVRPKAVLAGLPNAGKSTLFNRLAGSDTALVSSERGTTRDFLTRSIDWEDLSFELIDTAGWEDNPDGITGEAQIQRRAQIEQSDLLIWCSSANSNPAEQQLDNRLFEEARGQAADSLRLLTKIDLLADSVRDYAETIGLTDDHMSPELASFVPISALTEVGLAELQISLRSHFSTDQMGQSQWMGITAARCRDTLESVEASLGRAVAVAHDLGDELIAVDLRDALEHLGVILGVIYTDDILDRIFSKFCIGK